MRDDMVVAELLLNYELDSVLTSHLKDHYECTIKTGHYECLGRGPDLESAFYDAYRQVTKLQGTQYRLSPLPFGTTLDDPSNPSRWSRLKCWVASEWQYFRDGLRLWSRVD